MVFGRGDINLIIQKVFDFVKAKLTSVIIIGVETCMKSEEFIIQENAGHYHSNTLLFLGN